ncbi:MAG: hypothetical protein ACOC10_00590 [Bacteroidota bacterium]
MFKYLFYPGIRVDGMYNFVEYNKVDLSHDEFDGWGWDIQL